MNSIARRYATAIVESANQAGNLEQVTKELETFAALVHDNQDLRQALLNPVFTAAERKKALDALISKLSLSASTTRFLQFIGDRNRFVAIEAIARAVRRMADARMGKVRAQVDTASPLSADAQDSLRRALERRTGRTVELTVNVDPSLLGGIRTRIGSSLFDGTLRSQLDGLRESLLKAE
ncbi:MAG: ATP synthase F1 subunit delta [Myxococcota bacterium]